MKTKHTPGPWTIDKKSCIQGMGQQLVVIVYGRTEKERLANLDLIASAPDLKAQKEIDRQEIERLKNEIQMLRNIAKI